MTPVRLEHAASLSRVKHSTTEPLRFLYLKVWSMHFNTMSMNDSVLGSLVLYFGPVSCFEMLTKAYMKHLVHDNVRNVQFLEFF